MNKVNIVQSQLESMRRDSRSVAGVNACFILEQVYMVPYRIWVPSYGATGDR